MSQFDDSRTKVFVCNVTNGNPATYAAIPAQSGAFFYDPLTGAGPTFTETALSTNTTQVHRFVHCNTKGVLSFTKGFKYAEVFNAFDKTTSARVEQITYVGYNGTTGSMDATNSTYYGMKIILDHTFGLLNNSPMIVTVPYKSDASATQQEVALGLANAATNWLKRQAYKPFKVERINSGAQANGLAAATVSVVNGGTQIVTSDDETALIVAGTILRFGTSGAGTAPCYVVTGTDGGAGAARIYYLDQPYQGSTAAAYAAATFESVTEGNWGLKITGVSTADADFVPLRDEPFVVSFHVQIPYFTTATVTYDTGAYIGTGTYQEVAYMDAKSQFENKTRELTAYPQTVLNLDAISGYTYDLLSFEVKDEAFIDAVTGIRPISKDRYILAVRSTLSDDSFDTVLGL
jgi:hypothetical protein